MGEYVYRKSDKQRVKIGVCESLTQIRYDDRNKVKADTGSVNPAKILDTFWRLPYPDEDKVRIGEYENDNRGIHLYQMSDQGYANNFHDPSNIESPGSLQLRHDSGLLVSVPCFHGEKLPDPPEGWRVFWNGKSYSYELYVVKNTEAGLKPVVRCRHCRNMWRYEWADILPWIQDNELKARLASYE